MKVLNTRPSDQAAELTTLLRRSGFEVVERPAIATEPAWTASALASLADRSYAWVVLPSTNAGRYLRQVMPSVDLSDVDVVCGAATARALGLPAAHTLERFSAAAALAAITPKLAPCQRVLVPRAEEGRDELVKGLRALGVAVDDPIVYRTRTVPVLEVLDVDVITLCSPSAVRAIPSETRARIVCLGETTAHVARERGLRVAVVAASTDMASLVEAVLTAVAQVTVSCRA